ncbi:MAG: histidine--tRNA ligase [Acidobacteriaceae bacterium]|jgi:histidyl-tRNA synthetase|nr:histidine--tRNA ligase [Acidobacteriaceae bacterium]
MTQTSTKPPSGTRDFLPDDMRRREHVMRVVREVYESYGFEPLETPAFENIETLLGKYGEEGDKLIFKILRRGEHEASGTADLALRYDLTVPLARVVAQYQAELPRFFKRYQIQPVWRADRPQRGRFREFYQCDIDAIGSTSPVVESDLLAAVSEVLGRLHFESFVIRLNDRRLLTALLDCAGVAEALHGDALVALDKLDKIGADGVERELLQRGVSAEATRQALTIFSGAVTDPADSDAVLTRLEQAVAGHERGGEAVASLRGLLTLTEGTAAREHIRIDPSLARGLSYYTGAIMEIAVTDLPGSLGGGGRYDQLVGMFLGRDVPACGFSLGLERIIVVMQERDMFPAKVSRSPVDVMIACLSDPLRPEAMRLASELRAQKLRVEIYPESGRKLEKSLKYAVARSVPVLVIVGEDEQAKGSVTVRDLDTREQTLVDRDGAASEIARRVRLSVEH